MKITVNGQEYSDDGSAVRDMQGYGFQTWLLPMLFDAVTEFGRHKNKIRNGNFSVNQRAVSGVVTLSAGAYGHDGWKAGSSGCTYTFATSGNVTTITILAGSLLQVIEGGFLFTATHCLSWSGTAQGKIGTGNYSVSGVTGSATGGTNLTIEFNAGTLSKVQFEEGIAATQYEVRRPDEELDFNQFYLRPLPVTNQGGLLDGAHYATAYIEATVIFQTMRAAPSLVTSGAPVTWCAGPPGANQAAAYDYAAGAWTTITGALNISIFAASKSSILLRYQAATSFSGGTGLVRLNLGIVNPYLLSAEL